MPKSKTTARSSKAAAKEATADVDYSKWTVAAMKAELKKRDQETAGTKAVLLKRLLGDEDEQDGAPVPKKQSTIQKAISAMQKEVTEEARKKKVHRVDKHAGPGVVYKDYNCMLNQTNIGHNNNKYYVIQVIEHAGAFRAFTRWGRVGESGATATFGPYKDADNAVAAFEKKFHDKTRNKWAARSKFKPVPGKYTMIDVGEEDDSATASTKGANAKWRPSKLDAATQQLMEMIFNNDMFEEAMLEMEIDVNKMPLGKLSKKQIVEGFKVLDHIKQVIDKNTKGNLTELTSRFFTVIPHDFGRQRPPVINTAEMLRAKLDMLLTLSDIELAQTLLHEKQRSAAAIKQEELADNPVDANYSLLNCDLQLVKPSSPDYKLIEKYFEATSKTGWWHRAKKILNVWRMDRRDEKTRFAVHKQVENRKLLWHGTKVAVVAAILKSGLRIMPHSGGRVGRGIYFASECSKSAGYVGPCKNIGVMFLNEVVLGKEKHIQRDDGSLIAAPKGYHSVVALGTQEPDEAANAQLQLDGRPVIVPQAAPKKRAIQSSFDQSEYLVYQESQVRMRYMLTIDFA